MLNLKPNQAGKPLAETGTGTNKDKERPNVKGWREREK